MEAIDRGTPANERGQRMKLALIPLLVGVLGFVLWSGGDSSEPSTTALAPPTAAGAAGSNSSIPVEQAVPILSTVRPVVQIARTDPFALPPVLLPRPVQEAPRTADTGDSDPTADPLDTVMLVDPWFAVRDRWAAERVSVVLETPTGRVAVLGDRRVRVGDELDGECRVSEIHADGVVVEPLE